LAGPQPAGDRQADRQQPEQPEPGAGQEGAAELAAEADQHEQAEAEVLAGHNREGAAALADLREEQQQQQDVIEIGGNEGAHRREQGEPDPGQAVGRWEGSKIRHGTMNTMLEGYGVSRSGLPGAL